MTRRPASNPRLAVAYLRVSTEAQNLGPEAQRAAIEAWAAREGIAVAAWHSDQGVSGGADLDARPGLVAALADLRSSRAGLLVVAKRDRIARDLYVAATIERAASQSGARIVTADGAGNGDDDSSALLRGMLDVIGAHERRMIRTRTRAALAAKRAKGERTGECPYGFRVADDGVRLARDDAEQAVLAEVRALAAAGLSERSIVAALAAKGVANRAGRPLTKTSVHRVLVAARGGV
jgi:DNA invertase Pin-like site-specific DNA recombinase